MQLGLGLYRHMLTAENFRFAKQAGAEAIVAHMTDYWAGSDEIPATDAHRNWGVTRNQGKLWTEEELTGLRKSVEAEGLRLAALENLDPAFWYDVLLDGPLKKQQLEDVCELVRRIGRAGIPCLGYNFSIAGVWGHSRGPWARGGAESVAFENPEQRPLRNGEVWNMTYDPDAPEGSVGEVTSEQLWRRLQDFLEAVLPVAEEAGVKLAAHPDDPPLPTLRSTARLVYQPRLYQRLLDLVPSDSNMLEFCQGTIAEMSEGSVYEAIEQYASQRKIAYVHFRNVRGKIPSYHEVFVDEGDVDMVECLRLYAKHGFDGVMVPDHTPHLSCAAGWHAGMAYALGFMKGAMRATGIG